MDIRVGSIQPDSTRFSDAAGKRKRRLKSEGRHEEEVWSERSDYEEIEDCYAPSQRAEDESSE